MDIWIESLSSLSSPPPTSFADALHLWRVFWRKLLPNMKRKIIMGKMKMVSPTLASSNVKINALLLLWIQEAQFKENPLSNKSEENPLLWACIWYTEIVI